MTTPKLHAVPTDAKSEGGVTKTSPLDKFRSTRKPAIAGVETLQSGLPVMRIAAAKDWVRLHPDANTFWSDELCFVNVPVKGQKKDTLHLITEDLALAYLPSALIQRFRLVLASKPQDVFFLCIVPTQNLDNQFNADSVAACERAKGEWIMVTSRREEGVDGYKIEHTRDENPFDDPKWPKQVLDDLIVATFRGCSIESEDSDPLRRLVGARQNIS
jgi:hypothetical protein